MKQMLYVMDTFYPKVDGVIRFSEKMVPDLLEKFNVKVIAPNYGGNIGQFGGAPLDFYPVIKFIKINAGSVYYPPIYKPALNKEVRKSDIVFIQSFPLLGASALLTAKIYKKPVVMYFHQIGLEQLSLVMGGPNWFQKIVSNCVKFFTKVLSNLCDLIIVPSDSLIDVLNNAGIRAEKQTVELGVDTNKFEPVKSKARAKKKLDIDPKKTVIGYCGRLSDEKDIHTLVQAFQNLKQKNILLLLVGDGKHYQKYSRKHKIKLTGYVENVTDYYDAMDIFVMPSLTETTGLSTLEAMSSGLPVITTPVGLAVTSISDGYNGLIFSKKDVEGLKNHLNNLIKNKKQRKLLAKNARKTVIENFDWKTASNKILEIVEKLSD